VAEAAIDVLHWKRLVGQVTIVAVVWAAVLLGATAWWTGDAARQNLRDAGWELWLATFALFATNHLLRFIRWHWMLWVEGHPLPAARSLSIFLAGLALLPTPGKAGVAVRSFLLLREGVPVDVSLAAYFAERVFDLLGLVVLAALLFASDSTAGRWAATLGAGIAGVVAVRFAPTACRWLAARARAGSSLRRALAWSDHFFEHAAELVVGRWFLPYLLLGMAANAITGVLLWLAASQFGATIGYVDSIGIVAVSQLSGSLSLLPGGLGGFELAMLGQLSHFGVSAASGITLLALVRVSTLWGSVAIGLPLLVAGMRRVAKNP
jgi:glycosyltransferase 2 family protein